MATDFLSVPGVSAGRVLQSRNIFANLDPAQRQWLTSMAQIDGSLSRDIGSSPVNLLRAGLFLGKITTGGKYRPSIIGLTNGAISAATVTSVTVAAATATEVARLISVAGGNVSLRLNGPPSAAGTIAATAVTATAASGTTITVSSVALPAYVDKTLIQPADGSQIPVTLLTEGAGIDVNDSTGASVNQMLGSFLRGADLLSAQLIAGASAFTDLDTSIQTWLKQQINGGGSSIRGLFTFDNDR